MKEKLSIIRNMVEELVKHVEDQSAVENCLESIYDELDKLDVLAAHVDNYDDFDIETWAEELRQLVEEVDD